jgi:L-amino acid N-acyltransferase YncA
MNIKIRSMKEQDISEIVEIWNSVIEDGMTFPQEEKMSVEEGKKFFSNQTLTAVAVDEYEKVCGFYILHPNNVGRAGHIGNAGYMVSGNHRGKHIGESLVKDSIKQAKEYGFKILQFNAVVDSNIHARHLYKNCGFVDLGVIPKGFRTREGKYEDIHIMYLCLD